MTYRTWWTTVAICTKHWHEIHPLKTPVRVVGVHDKCVICRDETNIYVRAEVRIPS